MRDDYLDEKIDIYSFGNNIYGLLTGLWVFYENDDDKVVQVRTFILPFDASQSCEVESNSRYVAGIHLQGKVTEGQRPYIDDRYRNHSYIEGKLVELMERCWIEEPRERVDIFEAVRFLREVTEESKKQTN